MNSLWNFEDGFSITQEKEVHVGGGSWLPVTPAKPIPPRPHATPIHQSENLLGRQNWPEFGAPSNEYLHEIPSCSNCVQPSNQCGKLPQTEEFFGLDFDFVQRNQTTNQSVEPYYRALGIGNSGFRTGSLSDILASGDAAFMTSVEESLTRSLVMENEALDLNFPVESNDWIELNAGGMQNPAENNTFDNKQMDADCQHETPTSSQVTYDLNSMPGRKVPLGINNTIQFTPITPDQARSKNLQVPLLNSSVDKSVNQEKGRTELKPVSFTGTNAANPESNELLQDIVGLFKQKHGTTSGTDEGIDLNKTPQQRPPKRKKHRPKVIIEGRAKRTKTSQTPKKPNNVAENPSGKRKYVWKKGLKETPVAPQAEDATESRAAKVHSAVKSSRRALNFDLEEVATEARTGQEQVERKVQADMENVVNRVSNPQRMELSATTNILLEATGTSVSELVQQNRFLPQYQQGSMQSTASTSMDQSSAPYYSLSQVQAAVHQERTISDRQHGGDFMFTSGHSGRPAGVGVNLPNSIIGQISPSEQHSNNAGARLVMFQPKANLKNLTNSRQVLLNRFSQAASNVARGGWSLLNGQTHQSISSKVMWQRIISTLSEAEGKTNIEERTSHVSPLIEDSRQGQMRGPYSDIASRIFEAQKNDEMSRSYDANEVCQFLSNGYLQSMALCQQQVLFEQQAHSVRAESGVLSLMNQRDSATVIENHHSHQQLIRVSPNVPGNKQNTSLSATKTPQPAKLQTIQSPRRNSLQSAPETRGSTTTMKQTVLTVIDEITNQLDNLHLGGEEGAIVPYKGEGTIVPFEGKRRRPRPKVDIDSETNRMWNLLMGKERSEGLEENNLEKEKWWENEREVFRGRANSFIARMHLVQGDRRFSRWKGSVVDSVIGVFLTQNVSDHLSSSAFISLVARFPLNSSSHNKFYGKGKTKISVEEPEEFMMNGRGAFELYTNFQLVSNRSPIAVHSTIECWRDGDRLVTEGANLFEVKTHSSEEEAVSSQGSFDCSTVDGSGGIRSYSGSNSESEDLGASHKSDGINCSASRTFLHGERFMFHDINNQANGRTSHNHGLECRCEESNDKGYTIGFSANTHPITFESRNTCLSSPPTSYHHLKMAPELQVRNYDVFGEESTSSLTKVSTLGGERNGTTKQIEQPPESTSRSTIHDKRVLTSEQTQTTDRYIIFNKHQVHQKNCSQTGSQSGVAQRSQSDLENTTNEPNSNEQFSSSAKTYKEATDAKQAKAKGARAQVEKKIDWDTLRKDAQIKGAQKERSDDAMDSLDYVAMRQASINEISDTIKERGMNNMLAERIKDFLNRLVEEHGSIDLEWLRDVPPDKAKDYLLSIRGLGLKSVECVRLLTLHHLAFPVDTNVGRIAVRLGWVPLQPLPESLQLHLLELYPVLESIQKYLWPRLCKLDQRTLYELHYQLITFGKVFCTKSKPNCNACPMRGECRHFASAFASARLALPGPEEKSKAGSTVPLAKSSSTVHINPVSLHPLENHSVKEGPSKATNCQPIVEEPASPEQELGVLESDIEDGWGEDDDDDEIPTIKLNMEEFTENLQNFMQNNNMELQEGDMSKALVALNPGVASNPTRKLKNVSRLRTEHQVYELPDDHPLLVRMQKRELDDPSPYLLAIWTPGETANSVHPPEKRCEFQDIGSLCNEKTCFSCNNIREANSQTVRGTLLIPCRTAMRGSFPLNGTYFQVNEMFADHDTSINPIVVLRNSIWNLRRRTVYFGTSVSSIFKGLTTEEVQYCFWKGFVCVRGFEWGTRAPRPLVARLHFPQSKLAKTKRKNIDRK